MPVVAVIQRTATVVAGVKEEEEGSAEQAAAFGGLLNSKPRRWLRIDGHGQLEGGQLLGRCWVHLCQKVTRRSGTVEDTGRCSCPSRLNR